MAGIDGAATRKKAGHAVSQAFDHRIELLDKQNGRKVPLRMKVEWTKHSFDRDARGSLGPDAERGALTVNLHDSGRPSSEAEWNTSNDEQKLARHVGQMLGLDQSYSSEEGTDSIMNAWGNAGASISKDDAKQLASDVSQALGRPFTLARKKD